MADQVVIVTGARILADDPAATRWAREILTRELASASLVVAGDARGPDEWAHEIACAAGMWHERWQLDGSVMARLLLDWQEEDRWHNDPMPRRGDREGWRSLCLARNEAMIRHYRCPYGTSTARMVALYHPAARTQGTAHTVGLARAAGINVSEWTWGVP